MNMTNLAEKAVELREWIIRALASAGSGHPGGYTMLVPHGLSKE
jgi:transketolase N-terminal domain/subunit